MLNIEEIRKEFPILEQTVYGKPLVYLDNAATTQKPQCVIDAQSEVYTTINANVHRGIHHLSQVATEAMEQARQIVKGFIGAAHSHEIIFTRGTTESINLVASSFGGTFLKEGDEVTTIGGIIGTVVSVKDEKFVMETSADRVRVEFAKWALSTNDSAAAAAKENAKKAEEAKAKAKAEKKAQKAEKK